MDILFYLAFAYFITGGVIMFLYETIIGITNDDFELSLFEKLFYICVWPIIIYKVIKNL
jgi:hypothetical protein